MCIVLICMVQKGLVDKVDLYGLVVFEVKVCKVDLIGWMICEFIEDVLELCGLLLVIVFINFDLFFDDEVNVLMKFFDEESSV